MNINEAQKIVDKFMDGPIGKAKPTGLAEAQSLILKTAKKEAVAESLRAFSDGDIRLMITISEDRTAQLKRALATRAL
jgi:hypothetical protein